MRIKGFRGLLAALVALPLLLPSPLVQAAPSPAPQSAYGASVALSTSSVTSRVALTGDTSIFSVVQAINDGTVTAYVKPGTSSVVALTTDLAVAPGESISFTISTLTTHIAGITASGTAAVRIVQWNGGPNYSQHNYPYPTTTFALLPTASANNGKLFFVSDVGIAPGSFWMSDGTRWKPLYPITLARSGVQIPHTGDTNEFVFVQVTIPANTLGINGRVWFRCVFSFTTGTTNAKTFRVRYTAAAASNGTVVQTQATSTAANQSGIISGEMMQRALTNSQVFNASNLGFAAAGFSNSAVATTSVQTTSDSNLAFTGQLALNTESVNLESYEVVLMN